MTNIIYPIRINRYLALKGFCSRREADIFIQKGIVQINNQIAKIGQLVNKTDIVSLNTTKKHSLKKYVYFAYNKPRGIVTHSPEKGQKDIKSSLNLPFDVFPVGRLDRDSHGLIILTNDGRINKRLLHPDYEHEKEYIVKVNKPVTPMIQRLLSQRIKLEDFTTKPCIVKPMSSFSLKIILTEGKKHQIRRMCASIGLITLDLKRIRLMNITLNSLQPGQLRKITRKELDEFLKHLGL